MFRSITGLVQGQRLLCRPRFMLKCLKLPHAGTPLSGACPHHASLCRPAWQQKMPLCRQAHRRCHSSTEQRKRHLFLHSTQHSRGVQLRSALYQGASPRTSNNCASSEDGVHDSTVSSSSSSSSSSSASQETTTSRYSVADETCERLEGRCQHKLQLDPGEVHVWWLFPEDVRLCPPCLPQPST